MWSFIINDKSLACTVSPLRMFSAREARPLFFCMKSFLSDFGVEVGWQVSDTGEDELEYGDHGRYRRTVDYLS